MNEENEWGQNMDADLVEGPVQRVSWEAGKAAGSSERSVEMIVAIGEIRIGVMVELCQDALDGRGMPDEWVLSIVVPIFKEKGHAISCGASRGMKLLERRLWHMVKVDEMQLGFMPGKG